MAHSSGTNLLLFRVITPPSTGSFSIPWAVDATACNFLTPGLPIIPLYGDGDLTTTKFIQAAVECSSYLIFTSSCICSIGHIISPLNPIKGVVTGINWFLTSGRSQLKQCSYNISEANPPSTYKRCMQWPPISASIIIGPFIPSSSPKGGKNISGLGEKLLGTISSAHDSRLPLPPSEGHGHSHHFINCFWDFVMESFDEFRICASMHEFGDSHALWLDDNVEATPDLNGMNL
uniref:Uncharacterized protein n=1 Tax=Tanacetum cinerariifolium TaxID=118510 RepID=A0A6L2NRN1_TANCI|nr:hypothetical protein [Tanacetum cinerariifolium]